MKTILLFLICVIPRASIALPNNHQKVLMITDSHGEMKFGSEMVRLLEKEGHQVSAYAAGGSKPSDWLEGTQTHNGYWQYRTNGANIRSTNPRLKKIDRLLAIHHPNTVLIELGTNQIWRHFTAEERNNILQLARKVTATGAKCYWVGPPDLRVNYVKNYRANEIHDVLEHDLAQTGCKIFRSWRVTHYPTSGGDGIHYNDKLGNIGNILATKWARFAFWFFFKQNK